MPQAKSFKKLEEQVLSRVGAAERIAKLRQETREEIRLFSLRRDVVGKSQKELAERLGVSQAAVSQLENADDPRISTLRNYVDGLGGRLVIGAVLFDGDDEVVLPIALP